MVKSALSEADSDRVLSLSSFASGSTSDFFLRLPGRLCPAGVSSVTEVLSLRVASSRKINKAYQLAIH